MVTVVLCMHGIARFTRVLRLDVSPCLDLSMCDAPMMVPTPAPSISTPSSGVCLDLRCAWGDGPVRSFVIAYGPKMSTSELLHLYILT